MALVVGGIQVLTVQAGWEESLGTKSGARLACDLGSVALAGSIEADVRNGAVLRVGLVEVAILQVSIQWE